MTRILFFLKGEYNGSNSQATIEETKDVFCQFFTEFLKSTFNFDYCEEKDEPHYVFPK